MTNQTCPLCSGQASFSTHDFGRRKGFSCRNCTEFIITKSAESRLKAAPQSWKLALSQKAKATPPGKVLVITVPPIHKPGAANAEALQGECQPRES